MMIKKYFILLSIDFQLDIIEIGIIKVVNNIKYMDKPSIPR
jgi:hypothetical protein